MLAAASFTRCASFCSLVMFHEPALSYLPSLMSLKWSGEKIQEPSGCQEPSEPPELRNGFVRALATTAATPAFPFSFKRAFTAARRRPSSLDILRKLEPVSSILALYHLRNMAGENFSVLEMAISPWGAETVDWSILLIS